MSRYRSPRNDDGVRFEINPEKLQRDKCAPLHGGHDWNEMFSNATRTRVGVRCRKCKTNRVQDRSQPRNPLTGEYPDT